MAGKPDRRTFLKHVGAAGIGAAVGLQHARTVRGQDAGRRFVLGVIGCGGMGGNLIRSFAAMKNVVITHTCDVDIERARQGAKLVQEAAGNTPQVVQDLRRVLDDKQIEAVVIATPDHWHAPAAILACQAGKHVYVEKPCCHNIREGRLMIEAARRHNRVVQTGTQSRSVPHVIEAMKKLREGAIGEVLVAKAWNSQFRGSIGHATPGQPPAGLDYDLWVGPAPMRPYQSNLLHGVWRWWYDFGCGDIGNDGVHDIDIARWGLGVEGHPSTVAALGGKHFYDDDQQFPDTQYVIYEYASEAGGGRKRQLIYEQRIWSPYVQEGHENGNAFYGTKGMMILGKKSGWQIFGPRNEPGAKMDGVFDSTPHHRDFLEAMVSGRRPNADLETGHCAATLSHLGNIAARMGRVLRFDAKAERITGDEEADKLARRTYRAGHWAVPQDA